MSEPEHACDDDDFRKFEQRMAAEYAEEIGANLTPTERRARAFRRGFDYSRLADAVGDGGEE